jgi:hypothetical protein
VLWHASFSERAFPGITVSRREHVLGIAPEAGTAPKVVPETLAMLDDARLPASATTAGLKLVLQEMQ